MTTPVQTQLDELQARRASLAAEATLIHEQADARALSVGEQERFDRLTRGIEKIDDEIRGNVKRLAGVPGCRLRRSALSASSSASRTGPREVRGCTHHGLMINRVAPAPLAPVSLPMIGTVPTRSPAR